MRKLALDERLDSVYAFERYRDEQGGGESDGRSTRLKARLAAIIRDELTARQREIVTLYYYDNLTMERVAQMLGINKSTVCRHLAAARCKIEKLLKYHF